MKIFMKLREKEQQKIVTAMSMASKGKKAKEDKAMKGKKGKVKAVIQKAK